MGASEKAAATYHPSQGPARTPAWVMVTVCDERYRTATEEFPVESELAAPAIVESVKALVGRRVVDADALLVAMREQMTEAELHRDEPGYSRSACDAAVDAFGTVIDWFETEYLR